MSTLPNTTNTHRYHFRARLKAASEARSEAIERKRFDHFMDRFPQDVSGVVNKQLPHHHCPVAQLPLFRRALVLLHVMSPRCVTIV